MVGVDDVGGKSFEPRQEHAGNRKPHRKLTPVKPLDRRHPHDVFFGRRGARKSGRHHEHPMACRSKGLRKTGDRPRHAPHHREVGVGHHHDLHARHLRRSAHHDKTRLRMQASTHDPSLVAFMDMMLHLRSDGLRNKFSQHSKRGTYSEPSQFTLQRVLQFAGPTAPWLGSAR